MEHQAALRKKLDPRVFVSHAHDDDELPPDGRSTKAKGFVSYLVGQLTYELNQLGLGRGVWFDRSKLKSGHNFNEIIADELEKSDILLAIVSNNFVASDYCQDELNLFVAKLKTQPSGHQCILRVDKQDVANDRLPDYLRDIHTIPFYAKEPGSGEIAEFYWRGRPTRRRALEIAIKQLADDIFARLGEHNPIDLTEPPLSYPLPGCTRTVYVAKPAMDLEDAYQTLVRELQGRNIAVVPDPNRNIPTDGAAAAAFVNDAMDNADLSIHLLGHRRGWQPEGLPHIVPLQLIAARETAGRKPNFQRLIWAPKIVPGGPDNAPERDPVEVLAQLDSSTPHDEVVGDTAARFKDFVLQRVLPPTPPVTQTSIFVAAAAADAQCAAQAVGAVKALGARPTGATFNAGFKAAQTCDHIIICWGAAEEPDVLSALQAASQQLANARERGGKLCLLVYSPTSDAKQFALAVEGFGGAHLIIDATQPLQRDSLAPLLGDGAG